MSAKRRTAPVVLALGGLDPSCGAGVVADARSIEAFGCLPSVVVTALTVQSGGRVHSSTAVAPGLVAEALDEVLGSFDVAAIKIGQIPTAAVARTVAAKLSEYSIPVVVDPVAVAGAGGRLATVAATRATVGKLFPLATLVTVNLDEASALLGRRVSTVARMEKAAVQIAALGPRAVLVKGGHLLDESTDVLAVEGRVLRLRGSRIVRNDGQLHGTGCALASAAAAALGQGKTLPVAVREARAHVRALLRSSVRAGSGVLRAAGSGWERRRG